MAKISIYYFSATGNSLTVARDLSDELGGADVFSIAGAIKENAQIDADAVGIVYPVYMFGLPLIVKDFLERAKIKPGAYVFGVATLGGLAGMAHSQSRQILKARGIELAAGFSVLMPGNYTPLYGAIPEEKQQQMFAAEKLKVKEIAGFILGRKRGRLEEKPFLINFLLHTLLYRGGSAQIPGSAKNFWVTAAYTMCGLCAKVCPVENIRLVEGKPAWLGHCQHCMACLQWCPVEAIQYKQSTLGKKRYHHPGISDKDISGKK